MINLKKEQNLQTQICVKRYKNSSEETINKYLETGHTFINMIPMSQHPDEGWYFLIFGLPPHKLVKKENVTKSGYRATRKTARK
jgi:hypothetical protein